MTVEVVLPGSLADLAGGQKHVEVDVGDDVRFGQGLETQVRDGAEVQVLPSVAGG